jgi:hypothetical protein
MTVFVALVLAIVTFVFITYPLFKRRLRSVDAADDEKLRELHFKRDTTYSMLKELEFDLQAGILTKKDYQELERRYKGKAISILRGIDDSKKGTGVEDEIERQVLELRRDAGQFCPQCGARYQEGGRFCSHCGASLSQGGHVD